MDKTIINEGSARIIAETPSIVSKEMGVFYNPVMEFNRTISIMFLNALNKKNMKVALPLSGTGIRAIRFINELQKGKISKILINDISKEAVVRIRKNLELNNISNTYYDLFNHEATYFLKITGMYDYIDIDPFGSPNYFLDQSIKSLRKNGILAVTATDTAPLCGTYPKACRRKYWANPLRNELMHEIGLRILIRKIQLIGSQYDKALFPLLSYSKDHYFRVFLINKEGKKNTDELLKNHKLIDYNNLDITIGAGNIGPLWTGKLFDYKVMSMMDLSSIKKNSDMNFISTIISEAEYESMINNSIGFYDIHKIAKIYKIKIPRKKDIIEYLKSKNILNTQTNMSHF